MEKKVYLLREELREEYIMLENNKYWWRELRKSDLGNSKERETRSKTMAEELAEFIKLTLRQEWWQMTTQNKIVEIYWEMLDEPIEDIFMWAFGEEDIT